MVTAVGAVGISHGLYPIAYIFCRGNTPMAYADLLQDPKG